MPLPPLSRSGHCMLRFCTSRGPLRGAAGLQRRPAYLALSFLHGRPLYPHPPPPPTFARRAVANTYYARIHLARLNAQGQIEPETEVEVDARPSDAINLAVRFGSPMYVNRKIAESACASPPEVHMLNTGTAGASSSGATTSTGETHAEIARSVRETLASFEDPTSECGRGSGRRARGRRVGTEHRV